MQRLNNLIGEVENLKGEFSRIENTLQVFETELGKRVQAIEGNQSSNSNQLGDMRNRLEDYDKRLENRFKELEERTETNSAISGAIRDDLESTRTGLDMRVTQIEEALNNLRTATDQRFMKTEGEMGGITNSHEDMKREIKKAITNGTGGGTTKEGHNGPYKERSVLESKAIMNLKTLGTTRGSTENGQIS